MSKQLRISEDVHEMLTLLKPHDSTSYDDVILDLIKDICPSLPDQLQYLALLEQKNPREAAAERYLLKKDIYDNIIVNRMLRQREWDEEKQIDEHLESQKSDEEKEEDKKFMQHREEWMKRRREQVLRKLECMKKSD